MAKQFKGGVPPPEWRGVIFKLIPPPGTVILNLVALFADAGFLAAMEAHRSSIVGFHDSIGRWRDTQGEVVLELGSLDPATVYSYGGFSSDRETLAALQFQRKPTTEDLAAFDAQSRNAGVTPGEWWLSPSGTQAVLKRIEPHFPRLRAKKARERPPK